MKEETKELGRFLIVGSLAVACDAGGYAALSLVLVIDLAKGVSFIMGTLLAYALNNYWTFQYKQHNREVMTRFALLYLFSLGANVLANKASLEFGGMGMQTSFFIATGLSAAINFVGQKLWVFSRIKEQV